MTAMMLALPTGGGICRYEVQVLSLRQENQRLRDASESLDAHNRELVAQPMSSLSTPEKDSAASPRTPSVDIEEQIRALRSERDELVGKVEELEEQVSTLQQVHENDKRSFFSQRRVSETTLGHMKDVNEDLRNQLSELE